jgi:hypothetical protein
LQDDFKKAADFLAQAVSAHNYEDIRELRHRDLNAYETKQKIKKLAIALGERIKGYAHSQLSSAVMRAHFTAPLNNAKAPRQALLQGTTNGIPPVIDVWLVVETGKVYHPQAQLPAGGGAFQASVFIGSPNDNHGQVFPVHVLAVTEDVSKAFQRYRQDSATFKKWRGIPKPEDCKVLATVKIIRDDSASS